MIVRLKTSTSVMAAVATAGLLLSPLPAEAGDFRRGFLPGLIGGLAFGALATAAQASPQSELVYAAVQDAPEDVEYVTIVSPIRRAEPAPRVERQQAVRPRRAAAAPRQASATLERCREAIAASSRPYGSTHVRVAAAGEEQRRGAEVLAPLEARIAYTQRGRSQVRLARVTCHLNPNGQVVAFR